MILGAGCAHSDRQVSHVRKEGIDEIGSVTQLRMAGYDGAVSIEHEDSLMSADEGLRKAINLLNQVLIKDKPGEAYWAKLEG